MLFKEKFMRMERPLVAYDLRDKIKQVLADVTDLHIKTVETADGGLELCEDGVLFFPGPRSPQTEDEFACVSILLEKIKTDQEV